jgi:flavin reductase (DIM6/NTAB) family NADH-FMN oxidoreductase RutF
MAVDEKWQQALGRMVYGIYVLTTAHGQEVNGMIASWVSQISHVPPLVMVAVHPSRYTHHLIQKGGSFALHILSRSQQHLVQHFKGPDPAAKFANIKWFPGKTGCPILGQCLAYLECELKATYRPGNHALFIGEVVDGGTVEEGEPLSTFDYEGIYLGSA